MYSGKSEELMRRLRRAQIAGKEVILIKPSIDNRYDETRVVSHNGSSMSAFSVDVSDPHMARKLIGYPDVIGIDEIQFFYPVWVDVLIGWAEEYQVILAGLDMTYRREPFGMVPFYMAQADKVIKLSAVCHKCGIDAMYTQRLIDGKPAPFEGDTVQVGGLDSYEARCRKCFQIA